MQVGSKRFVLETLGGEIYFCRGNCSEGFIRIFEINSKPVRVMQSQVRDKISTGCRVRDVGPEEQWQEITRVVWNFDFRDVTPHVEMWLSSRP